MQLAELWATTNGLLDDVEPNAIGAFEQRLPAHADAFTYLEPRLRASSGLDAELTTALRLKPRHLFRSN